MIPLFPSFKNIHLSDKRDVEKLTSEFPPYSDFNFYSMWGWDIHNKMMISQLNKNLVVLFNDYLSGENFLSFIGNYEILKTTTLLIEFSKKKYHKTYLRLIPEETALRFKGSNFNIKEDRDSFDYIYLVEHLANIDKWKKNTCGKKIRNFLKTQPHYIVKHSTVKNISLVEYESVFRKWAKSKNINDDFDLNEYRAFKRLLEISSKNLRVVSLFIDGVLVGFTLYEILSKNYAVSHFAKADINYHSSVYDLLNWEEAKYLHSQGIKYFNWEQDLGIAGLRYSKIKYKPAFFLRKLTIELKLQN